MKKLQFWFILLTICSNVVVQAQRNKQNKKIDSLNLQIIQCEKCSDNFYARAKVYLAEDKKMEAMADLNKAIEINLGNLGHNGITETDLTIFFNERAYLKYDLQDYRGAIQDFNNAIDINAGYASLWEKIFFGKGNSEAQIMDSESAIKSYKRALIFNKDNAQVHYNIGLMLIRLYKFEEGCLNLSKAGELGETDAYKMIKEYCN